MNSMYLQRRSKISRDTSVCKISHNASVKYHVIQIRM